MDGEIKFTKIRKIEGLTQDDRKWGIVISRVPGDGLELKSCIFISLLCDHFYIYEIGMIIVKYISIFSED